MDITTISLVATMIILAISIVILGLFGLKNLFSGKHDLKKILSIATPFAIFGISFGVMGTAADAGIFTMIVMISLMAVLIVLSGLKSIF
jgi:hypothetical protein